MPELRSAFWGENPKADVTYQLCTFPANINLINATQA
jgi:hypothetical protein